MKKGKANGHGTFCDMNNHFRFTGEWEDSKPKEGQLTLENDKNVSNVNFTDFVKGKGVINYKDTRKY